MAPAYHRCYKYFFCVHSRCFEAFLGLPYCETVNPLLPAQEQSWYPEHYEWWVSLTLLGNLTEQPRLLNVPELAEEQRAEATLHLPVDRIVCFPASTVIYMI